MSLPSKTKQRQAEQIINIDALKQINVNAAGLDIGAAEIWASVFNVVC